MCQSITLTTKGNTLISYCSQCQTHYIWQKSYVLTFTSFQYNCFAKEIMNKVGKEEFLDFPDGRQRLLLRTPIPEVFFTFSEEEWRDFTDSLREAYYMREVYNIIH